MDGITTGRIRCYPDGRGNLFVAESGKDVPFDVKRVYYISGVTDRDTTRGSHAHKKLKQMMFCVGGVCDVIFDNGLSRETVRLDAPDKYVLVGPGIWREMTNFDSTATLMVLASDLYDECDYIRNYDDYLNYLKGALE